MFSPAALSVTDASAPASSGRGVALEPERLVPIKAEVQVDPGQQNHNPRAQRTYTEELRRDPITDKYVPRCYVYAPRSTCISSSFVPRASGGALAWRRCRQAGESPSTPIT